MDAFDGQVARLDPSKVPAAGAPEAQMVSDGSQKGLQFCGSSTCSEGLHTRRCWKGPGNFGVRLWLWNVPPIILHGKGDSFFWFPTSSERWQMHYRLQLQAGCQWETQLLSFLGIV